MSTPITRDEDADRLLILHSVLRKAVVRHHSSRLDIFTQIFFQDATTSMKKEEISLDELDIVAALKKVLTQTIAESALFKQLVHYQSELLIDIQSLLNTSNDKSPKYDLFKKVTSSMRRFDLAVNRFDTGVTASLTDVDELTGLLNRTAMERDLKREIAHSKRTGENLCLAMIDADHFKEVNDLYGHGFGDIVLEELAERFETSLRPRDRIYRYGGEEFLVALPDTDLSQVKNIMERLRIHSADHPIRRKDVSISQTVSIGITDFDTDEELETAIKRADEALYRAKESGRNQVQSITSKAL